MSGTGNVAAIVDIDGVLIHGKSPIPGAREALLRLIDAHVPVCLVTNGGGVPRMTKAKQVASILSLDPASIAQRLVAAHDPIPALLQERGLFAERVLVLSKSEEYSHGISSEWALPDAVTLGELESTCPWIFPTLDDGRSIDAASQRRVAAICVIATPENWGHSLQLACDLLLNHGRLFPNAADSAGPPALFVSNPDFDYRARPPLNRMTTGAWLHCLASLMQHYGGRIDPILTGKPHSPIYELARHNLEQQQRQHGGSGPLRLVAIGDNPIADIRGARACGAQAVLVLTGVATQDDPDTPADLVCASIVEAVAQLLANTQ